MNKLDKNNEWKLNLTDLINEWKFCFHCQAKIQEILNLTKKQFQEELNSWDLEKSNNEQIFKHWNSSFIFNENEIINLDYLEKSTSCIWYRKARTKSGKNILILEMKDWNNSIIDCDNWDFIIKNIKIILKEFKNINWVDIIPDKIMIKWNLPNKNIKWNYIETLIIK